MQIIIIFSLNILSFFRVDCVDGVVRRLLISFSCPHRRTFSVDGVSTPKNVMHAIAAHRFSL